MIILMCGLSGSGKSTIAKTLGGNIVSSDAIREELCGSVEDQSKNDEVFKVFFRRIRELLEQRKDVIADATNLTMRSRRGILHCVPDNVEKVCYIVPKKYEECLKDNQNRLHPVPNYVIEKQLRQFEIPFLEEGFDKIIIHDFGYKHDLRILRDMLDFDQKNPHHTEPLYEHSLHTAQAFEKKYPGEWAKAAAIHDIGKLLTQTFDEDGIAHYYSHHNVGSYYVLSHAAKEEFGYILDRCFLINYHMFSWDSDIAKERWRSRFGAYKYTLLTEFNKCDKTR